MASNLLVRNMDVGVPHAGDNRRLEVVVDGLPLFSDRQLAVDTTLVSALKGNGEPMRGAADRDGVALSEARRVKERTYPELVGPGARAQLVVLALEVGGRWSEEAKIFIRLIARARARSASFGASGDYGCARAFSGISAGFAGWAWVGRASATIP